MGMFDTFWTTEKIVKCPNGHIHKNGFQTKKFECFLNDYHVGDVVDPAFIEAKVWTYNWCAECSRAFGRYVLIKNTRFVGWTDIEWEDEANRES